MIKKITLLLFVFLLTLVSCVSTSPTGIRLKVPLSAENLHQTVYIDDTFNQDQQNVLISSLLQWECSTNYIVKFDIHLHYTADTYDNISNKKHALIILNVDSKDKRIVESDMLVIKDDPGFCTFGLYASEKDIPAILMVMDRLNIHTMPAVSLHEIGHSLQIIAHVNSTNAVMFKEKGRGARHITDLDLEAFCKLYGCDEKKLHACH